VITLASDLYFLIAGKATTLAAVLLSVRHRASARDMGTNYRLFAHLRQSFFSEFRSQNAITDVGDLQFAIRYRLPADRMFTGQYAQHRSLKLQLPCQSVATLFMRSLLGRC